MTKDMISTYHNRHKIWVKAIAMVVVCLFLVNDIVWAYPDGPQAIKEATLARWLVTRSLMEVGVEDPAKVELEAVTGISFLARGMELQTVNSLLAENASRAGIKPHTEFLSSAQEDGVTTAQFCLAKNRAIIFKVSRDKDGQIEIRSAAGPAGEGVSGTKQKRGNSRNSSDPREVALAIARHDYAHIKGEKVSHDPAGDDGMKVVDRAKAENLPAIYDINTADDTGLAELFRRIPRFASNSKQLSGLVARAKVAREERPFTDADDLRARLKGLGQDAEQVARSCNLSMKNPEATHGRDAASILALEVALIFERPNPSAARLAEWSKKDIAFRGDGVFTPDTIKNRALETLRVLDLKKGETLLDIGCGPRGGFGLIAALMGLKVTVYENHPKSLEFLKKRLAELKPYIARAGGSFELIEKDFTADGAQDPIAGKKFTNVIATDVVTSQRSVAEDTPYEPPTYDDKKIEKILGSIITFKSESSGNIFFSVPDMVAYEFPKTGEIRYSGVSPFVKEMIARARTAFGGTVGLIYRAAVPYSLGIRRGIIIKMGTSNTQTSAAAEQENAPPGMIEWLQGTMNGQKDLRHAAAWSFLREEGIFSVVLINMLPWFLAVTGFLDNPYTTLFYIASVVLYGISHDRLYRWKTVKKIVFTKDGKPDARPFRKIYDNGSASLYHKAGFILLGAIFRAGYLIPVIGPIAGPVLAFASHAIYNNLIAPRFEWLPAGTVAKVKKTAAEAVDVFMPIYQTLKAKRIQPVSMDERWKALAEAGYNPWQMPAADILYNLITDDSNGVPLVQELAARKMAEDSGAELRAFEKAWNRCFSGMGFVRVLSRGGDCERILANLFITKAKEEVVGTIHPEPGANHIEEEGGLMDSAFAMMKGLRLDEDIPFQGDPDLKIMEKHLRTGRAAYVLIMLSNNEAAGQPVSIKTLRKLRELVDSCAPGTPVIFDAARIWDNAQAIKEMDPDYKDKNIAEIVNECADLADGLVISAKKNITGMGGIIAFKSKKYFEDSIRKAPDKNRKLISLSLDRDNVPLSAGDIAHLRRALEEAFSDEQNAYQSAVARRLWERLRQAGVPVTANPAKHAVYIRADKFFEHITGEAGEGNPAITLNTLAYLEGGIAGTDFGVVGEGAHRAHLFRLALARRRWSAKDVDYIADVIINVYKKRHNVKRLCRLTNGPEIKKTREAEIFAGKYTPPETDSSKYGHYYDAPRFRTLLVTIRPQSKTIGFSIPRHNSREAVLLDASAHKSWAFEKFETALRGTFGFKGQVYASASEVVADLCLKHWARSRFGGQRLLCVTDAPSDLSRSIFGKNLVDLNKIEDLESFVKKGKVAFIELSASRDGKDLPRIRAVSAIAGKYGIPVVLKIPEMFPGKYKMEYLRGAISCCDIAIAHGFAAGVPAGFIAFNKQSDEGYFAAASDVYLGYRDKQNVSPFSYDDMAGALGRLKEPVPAETRKNPNTLVKQGKYGELEAIIEAACRADNGDALMLVIEKLAGSYKADYSFRKNTIEAFTWFYFIRCRNDAGLLKTLKARLRTIYSERSHGLWVRKAAADAWAELESRSIRKRPGKNIPRVYDTNMDINVTDRCNKNCLHCVYGGGKRRATDDMDAATLDSIIAQIDGKFIDGVMYTGGEPFLRKDLILHAIQNSKVTSIPIFTNGYWGAKPDDAEAVLKELYSAAKAKNTHVDLHLNMHSENIPLCVLSIVRAHHRMCGEIKGFDMVIGITLEDVMMRDGRRNLKRFFRNIKDLLSKNNPYFTFTGDEAEPGPQRTQGMPPAKKLSWGFVLDGRYGELRYYIKSRHATVTSDNEGNVGKFVRADISAHRNILHNFMDKDREYICLRVVINASQWANPFNPLSGYSHPRLWNFKFMTILDMVNDFKKDPFWQMIASSTLDDAKVRVKELLERLDKKEGDIESWFEAMDAKHNDQYGYTSELTQDALMRYLLRKGFAGPSKPVAFEYPELIMPDLVSRYTMPSGSAPAPAYAKKTPPAGSIYGVFEHLSDPNIKGALTGGQIAKGLNRSYEHTLYRDVSALYYAGLIDTDDKDAAGKPGKRARWFVPENVKKRSAEILPILSEFTGKKLRPSRAVLDKYLPKIRKILKQTDQAENQGGQSLMLRRGGYQVMPVTSKAVNKDGYYIQAEAADLSVRQLCRQAGLTKGSEINAGKIAHELATNMLDFGEGGVFGWRKIVGLGGDIGIEVAAWDNGPGIDDPETLRKQNQARQSEAEREGLILNTAGGMSFTVLSNARSVTIESNGNKFETDQYGAYHHVGPSNVTKGALVKAQIIKTQSVASENVPGSAPESPAAAKMTAVNFERVKKSISAENTSEKRLLAKSSKYLGSTPVNEHIDISAIPRNGDQLMQNMKTIARLIAWNNTFGLNIRYILDNDPDGRALAILRSELTELSKIPGINSADLLSRIGTPHTGDNVINIYLATVDNINKLAKLADKEYAVALKDDPKSPGVSIPNYAAASAVGLAIATLRSAKEMEGKEGYEGLRKKTFDIVSAIYRRYGIIRDDKEFTVDDLEFMVSGCSENKLKYAILYALPPIVKDLAERLQRYHEALQLLLRAA